MINVMIPEGYKVIETNEKVQRVDPELITRFRWRANLYCKKLNRHREVPFYRFEVHDLDNRYAVVAMQNKLIPVD